MWQKILIWDAMKNKSRRINKHKKKDKSMFQMLIIWILIVKIKTVFQELIYGNFLSLKELTNECENGK